MTTSQNTTSMKAFRFLTYLLVLAFAFSFKETKAQTKTPKQTFRYSEMASASTKTLYVRTNPSDIVNTCDPEFPRTKTTIKTAKLNVVFNWNNDFLSANTTTYNVTYTITGYSSYSGSSGSVITYTANNISTYNGKPQGYTEIDFTSLHSLINRFDVKMQITTSGGANVSVVSDNLFLDSYYTEEFEYDVKGGANAGISPLIGLSPIDIIGNNIVKFSWACGCGSPMGHPNYQFQLLRLFNNNPSNITTDKTIRAFINWDEALTIETGNSATTLSLTIAEGEGYYLWRVRPIGNAYEGGIANDRNWGLWTSSGTYTQGATQTISTGTSSYLFYFSYNQWMPYSPSSAFNSASYPNSTAYSTSADEGKRNWIFNRNFVEGDASTNGQVNIGEGISYANKLQMANQKQVRITSENKKLISQSIYDYSGRAAMQVLPTPVTKTNLGYETAFVKNTSGQAYSAINFDMSFAPTNTLTYGAWPFTNNYKSPTPMDSSGNSPSNYYSSNNVLEDNVPTAAGYPFTRTLFSKDGKNTAIESSMPGKAHQINSGTEKHTTRAMESGVADIELVRVFGDEAPDEKSVYKTITIDPNNTASVAYLSKEGKTIATCLSSPTSTYLVSLPSASAGSFAVVSNINNNNTASGPFAFHSFKTLALTEATNVTLNYSLTPNTYQDSCYNLCQTCDYKITLTITGNNDEINPITLSYNTGFNPASCTATSVVTNTTVNLPPGEYSIERKIESNTIASGTSNTYINNFISAVTTTLQTDLRTGTGTVVDDAGNPVFGAPSVNMATFFSHLDVATPSNSLAALYSLLGGVTSTETHKNIQIGCNTLRVPVWQCAAHTCLEADSDFEGYLFAQMNATNTAQKQATLTAMFGAPISYTLGEFNTVIQYMLNNAIPAYSCTELWKCWESTVGYFKAQNITGAMTSTTATLTLPGSGSSYSFTGDVNYLDMFLNCTKYRIPAVGNSTVMAVSTESLGGFRSHPYKYFEYDATCCVCETAFIGSYSSCTVTPSSAAPSACGAINTFTAWFNAVNSFTSPCTGAVANYPTSYTVSASSFSTVSATNKSDFLKCLINSNATSNCSVSISSGSFPTMAAANGTSITAICKTHCEELYPNFVAQSISLYHQEGKYVQGDTYTLTPITSTVGINTYTTFYVGTATLVPSVTIPLATIYCEANAMVAACQASCALTVQANNALGSDAQIKNMQAVMSGQFLMTHKLTEGSYTYCPSGYTGAPIPTDSVVRTMVRYLNYKLSALKTTAPSVGMWWDFKGYITSIDPTVFSPLLASTTQSVFIHPDVPSYFAVVPGTVSGNKIRYYFNKAQGSSSSTTPKALLSLTPTIASSANFVYSTASSSLASVVMSTYSPSYIFSTTFTPVVGASVSTGTFLPLPNALADGSFSGSPLLTSTSLVSYTYSGVGAKGFWQYDVSNDISGTEYRNCESVAVCYKLQSASTASIPASEIVDLSPTSCETQTALDIRSAVYSQLSAIYNSNIQKLQDTYYKRCIKSLQDYYTATYSLKYHHYTLYYYDRAGNLVKTVPPAGVTYASASRTVHPAHAMITEYEYNSLKQLVRQKTPDGGETTFLYDAKGKLRFSQNAKQKPLNKYSYTKYDELTRIVEVGEFTSASVPSFTEINTITHPATGGSDITKTVYSTPAAGITYFGGKPQRYLQNRVSYSFTDKDGNIATTTDQVLTYYSYDPHGNVEWLIQDIPEIGRNYMAYEYDLVSGSVIKVKYNEEFADRFFHRYAYDIDKRIKTVETSTDGIYWERDAAYNYYLHGPLKRAELGHDRVQGLDYAYTINGWLKGLNGTNQSNDLGGDGSMVDKNMYVARDAYSMVLGYFKGDYNSKSSILNSGNFFNLNGNDLFNGNISSWTNKYDTKAMYNPQTGIDFSSGIDYNANNTGRTFRYDELNRLVSADFKVQALPSTNTYTWNNSLDDYKETFSYDANGNIINLLRNGRNGNLNMDNFTYRYYKQDGSIYNPNLMAPPSFTNITNKLAYVVDEVISTYSVDIDNQSSGNYTYDEIGNLTSDASESITAISWNVYGKISSITKATGGGNTTTISFLYDASGNRVYKKVSPSGLPFQNEVTTYYAKDASGNNMAVYERKNVLTNWPNYTATFTTKEQAIYGSDRLGIRNKAIARTANFTSSTSPTVQLVPIGIHTSSYPNIMLPLANNTQKQVYAQDIKSNITTAITLGTAEYVENVSALPSYSLITYKHSQNQALAYDAYGNVLLSAYSYSVFSGATYSTTISKIWVKDVNPAITLTGVAINPNAQSVFMKKPGTTDQYYFFTIGNDQKAYYHTIDASLGVVVDQNTALDANADYGNTMALFEDRTGQGPSTLYLRRFNSGLSTNYIAPFTITETGITSGNHIATITSLSWSNNCDMQISPSGTLLAVAYNDVIFSGTLQTYGVMRLYSLSANHQTITPVATRTVITTSTLNGAKSLEFSNNDVSLFYTTFDGSTTNLMRLPIATFITTAPTLMYAQASSAIEGSIRKGLSNALYYVTSTTSAPTTATIRMFTTPDAAITHTVSNLANTITNGRLALQPHLLAYSVPTTSVIAYAREWDKKEYELKDHLGNIHATIKDYKVPFSGTSDVTYDARFENATTGLFTLMSGAPAGSSVSNVSSTMRVLSGTTTGATARALIPITSAGQYMVSFDYSTSTPTLDTRCLVNNATNGASVYYIAGLSRHDFVVNMPTGATNIDLRFSGYGTGSNMNFDIDNVLIKKLVEPITNTISVLQNEDYTTNTSNWIATNTYLSLTNYFPGTQLVLYNAFTGTPQYMKKTVNVAQDQLYRITFDASTSDMAGAYIDFNVASKDGTKQSFIVPDSEPTLVSYTFYVIPRTNQIEFYIGPSAGATSYDYSIVLDNFKIENVVNPANPMYSAVLNNLTETYAFGSPLVGRQANANTYRYGFNGKENDNETSTQDYGMRIYNPRLGRFLSVDPLTAKFSMLTPYQFASNTPIQAIDLDGLEAVKYHDLEKKSTTILVKLNYWEVDANNKPGVGEVRANQVKKAALTMSQKYNGSSTVAGNEVRFVVFVEKFKTKDDAIANRDANSEFTSLLEPHDSNPVTSPSGGVKVGGAQKGKINFPWFSQHTFEHEVMHLVNDYSENTPSNNFENLDYGNQDKWHNDKGGVFDYRNQLPINDANIQEGIKNTGTYNSKNSDAGTIKVKENIEKGENQMKVVE